MPPIRIRAQCTPPSRPATPSSSSRCPVRCRRRRRRRRRHGPPLRSPRRRSWRRWSPLTRRPRLSASSASSVAAIATVSAVHVVVVGCDVGWPPTAARQPPPRRPRQVHERARAPVRYRPRVAKSPMCSKNGSSDHSYLPAKKRDGNRANLSHQSLVVHMIYKPSCECVCVSRRSNPFQRICWNNVL